MDFRETLRIASRSIRSHKLRSVLTVIGVVIGIASVITFATFGASVEADIVGDIGGTTASNVYVLPTPGSEDDDDGGPGPGIGGLSQPVFTTSDVEGLREIEGVREALPRGNVGVSALSHANDTVSRDQITATTPASFPTDAIVEGRAFDSGEREVVVSEAATQAFEANLSVGDSLAITRANGERTSVEVVGVANRTTGQFSFASFAGQPRFYVPIEPFYQTTIESPSAGAIQRAYPQVTVVAEPARIETVKSDIQAFLADSDAAELKPQSV